MLGQEGKQGGQTHPIAFGWFLPVEYIGEVGNSKTVCGITL